MIDDGLLHLGVVAGDVKDGTPLQLEVGEGGALVAQQEFLLILSVEIRCGWSHHATCCSSVTVREPM
jgi:hypothetical protein